MACFGQKNYEISNKIYTSRQKCDIVRSMEQKAAVEMKEHSLRIWLNEEESARLKNYLNESGMKKQAVIRRAILAYLDRQEQA